MRYRNYEMPSGAWDFERENADDLSETLERQGNLSACRLRNMKKLLSEGKKEEAARACPHGWSRVIRRGQSQCLHCGSIVASEYPKFGDKVIVPCAPIDSKGGYQ